ncbi:MAG: site-specific DNA-methyltransferase [Chitinivibrionales bacterium]|nr:site-specific DNA-methyltransferase [Chitinivibrionales bacterium]
MTVESIKHKNQTRVHIPSKEEAGTEDASPKVKEKAKAEYPKNPIVHRGQDPELFWLNKYGNDDRDDSLNVDIRSLYRHEHISPEVLIKKLYEIKEEKGAQTNLFDINELFGHSLHTDELEKVSEYYKHQDGWSNRLIQGDSLLVMTSLLEREGMAGKVQMVYFDPPYGINYGSNWQIKINNLTVKEGDNDLSGQPEQVKAYRDTWVLGIHSYLSYLRDRLIITKELLTDSGSCFIQISDENAHLVRSILDEIFGAGNFICDIRYRTRTMTLNTKLTDVSYDHIIWFAKNKENVKYRRLFFEQVVEGDPNYKYVELADGKRRLLTNEEKNNHKLLPKDSRVYRLHYLKPSQYRKNQDFNFRFNGKLYPPPGGDLKNTPDGVHSWATLPEGMSKLAKINRLQESGSTVEYVLFNDDYPVSPYNSIWTDTAASPDKYYVVQTAEKVIERCLLTATDPGDLVLDPTCGSGTDAYVCEKWGRRWITIDTSRIALNIAKTRLMTAVFLYYKLYDEKTNDVRQGFVYQKVPHITLTNLANDEPAEEETLFDQPLTDKKTLRVSGPFTVETLQAFEPVSPESLDASVPDKDETENFEARIFEHLKSAGVKNGIKNENAVFIRVERLSSAYLHAEGFYSTTKGEKKAYLHIGPKFGTVSKQAVNEAVKECRNRGDADWLIILGFSFESNISNESITTSIGTFEVTKARMHDDLLQEGLLKKDKKAASFVTIGEPDMKLHKKGKTATVELLGIDIYDPIKDEVKGRSVADIAYWMVDDDYDGSNFVVRQVFFCGGDKDEFDKWQKGLSDLSKTTTKTNAERTLKIEIDDEAFDRLYGYQSHPIEIKSNNQKIAVRVLSQFGEEVMKVLSV